MSKTIEVCSLLIDIEAELRQLNLWQGTMPSPEALASTEPFAIDTLSFPQWLQFIFLVKLYALIEQQQPLPSRCSITPMASEYFKQRSLNAEKLLAALFRLDTVLSE